MKVLENLSLALIAVFAPVQAVVLTTLALVFIDLITGLVAARKRGEKITSAGIKRTVGKILLYEIAIAAAFLAETYLIGNILPVSKLVSALIGIVELKSILENLDGASGNKLFETIISRLVQSEKDVEDKK